MSSGPIELRDNSGLVRFEGQASPAPGGGSTLFEISQVTTPNVEPADPVSGFGTFLNWGHVDGDTLLDYTDPAFPTVVADGTYLITAAVSMVNRSVDGGYLITQLGANSTPAGGQQSLDQTGPVAADSFSEINSSIVRLMAAGDPFYMSLAAHIAETMDYFFVAYIAKLS